MYCIISVLCIIAGRLCATESYYGGTFVAGNAAEDMRVQDLRMKDFSSPYHVSSNLRRHSYAGDKRGSELFNNHSRCASWSVEEYHVALWLVRGKVVACGDTVPPTYRTYYRDVYHAVYLDHADLVEVFQQWKLYEYDNFRAFLKQLPDYDEYIAITHKYLYDQPSTQKKLSSQAFRHIGLENDAAKKRAEAHERQLARERYRQEQAQKEREQQQLVQTTYREHAKALENTQGDWHELCDVYEQYQLGDQIHLEKRIDALCEMNSSGAVYTRTTYNLDAVVAQLLGSHGYNATEYKSCYGNQLQQVVHSECIDILGRVASPVTPLIIEKDVVVDCVDAAREYNQSGLVHKACQVADMCWAMLDYSRITLENIATSIASNVVAGVQEIAQHPQVYINALGDGLGKGLCMPVKDIYDHPVQTVAYAVAGKYILQYHLSKVFLDLFDISLTAIVDYNRARKKWDDYIAPITAVITAIEQKKIVLRDAVENGSALIVGWKTQGALLDAAGKLYRSVKDKALEWIRDNPLAHPEQYMMTPDGRLFKAIDNFERHHGNSGLRFTPGALGEVLLSREAAIERTWEIGKKLQYTEAEIKNLLSVLDNPDVDGCIRTFATAVDKFEHSPGFRQMIQRLFEHCNNPKATRNVKGACNELRVALKLQDEGHAITEFGLMIDAIEYDIVTTTHIIECKNLYWDHYKGDIEKLNKLVRQATIGVQKAQELGKQYTWITKKGIPSEIAWLKDALLKAGVEIIEG